MRCCWCYSTLEIFSSHPISISCTYSTFPGPLPPQNEDTGGADIALGNMRRRQSREVTTKGTNASNSCLFYLWCLCLFSFLFSYANAQDEGNGESSFSCMTLDQRKCIFPFFRQGGLYFGETCAGNHGLILSFVCLFNAYYTVMYIFLILFTRMHQVWRGVPVFNQQQCKLHSIRNGPVWPELFGYLPNAILHHTFGQSERQRGLPLPIYLWQQDILHVHNNRPQRIVVCHILQQSADVGVWKLGSLHTGVSWISKSGQYNMYHESRITKPPSENHGIKHVLIYY